MYMLLERQARGSRGLKSAAALMLLASTLSFVFVSSATQAAQEGQAPIMGAMERRIDPKADRLLRQMCDYLGGLKAFTVQASNTLDVIQVDGQKLQFEAIGQVTLQRPNRVHVRREGVVGEGDFYYDGKSVTMYLKSPNFYATEAVPSGMDGALDVLRDNLGIDVPGADLLYSDCYAGMTWDVAQATYLGLESIGATTVHHLAFRTPTIDFQLWVEDGAKPLPRKYLITTKWTTGAPEFGVELTDWNLSPKIDDAMFTFVPPAGARKIDFLK